MARRHDIESETSILPWVVAETVVQGAEGLAGTDIPDVQRGGEPLPGAQIPPAAIEHLVEHADAVYNANSEFRRKVKQGNAGRDHLYIFMEHWLAAWLKKHAPRVFRALPYGYGFSYSPTVNRNREMAARYRALHRRKRRA